MHNDIITQNIKLIDEKLIINEKKFEIIKESYIKRIERKKVAKPPQLII